MSNNDLDFDAIVRTAASFSLDQREKFLLLISPDVRAQVAKKLLELDQAEALQSAPTVIENADLNRGSTTPSPKTTNEFPQGSKDLTHSSRSLPPTVVLSPSQSLAASQAELGNHPDRKEDVSLLRLHARGAVGEIYVAFDDQLSRELALKRLRPELPHSDHLVRRFIREAEITAKLQHPGIVPIYNLNVSGADSHYTMPLVSGSTMEAMIPKVKHWCWTGAAQRILAMAN